MWTETFEPYKSKLDGSMRRRPAIECNGVLIVRSGFMPESRVTINYREEHLDLEFIGTRDARISAGTFRIWFSSAFQIGSRIEDLGKILTTDKKEEIKKNLSTAIPIWRSFLTKDESPISNVVFS